MHVVEQAAFPFGLGGGDVRVYWGSTGRHSFLSVRSGLPGRVERFDFACFQKVHRSLSIQDFPKRHLALTNATHRRGFAGDNPLLW